ncbi:TPA: von Willebrand factor binding protein Vwb [Staphylococcus aureus]|nr:von Willebrand factor binding protein Vwb [Staphylococcus aureus]
MKKKVLILTLGALCASQLWNSDNASAIVTGEKNPYTSKALLEMGQKNKNISLDQYKDSLESVMNFGAVDGDYGYDQPEYKEAIDTYQKKIFAEIDAINKFLAEEKKIERYNKKSLSIPINILGLTQQRYSAIYQGIKESQNELKYKIENIEERHSDLKKFDWEREREVRDELNELENKILMLGQAFPKKTEARLDLYNKLDMIVGFSEEEREKRHPKNERLLKERIEDLETIIDEFFDEINENRPTDIPALSDNEENNKVRAKKLREHTKEAKKYISKRSKRSLDKQKHNSLSEEVSEEQKVKYNKEMEEIKEKFLAKSKLRNPVASLIDDEDDNGKHKQLIISTPTNKPIAPPTYTETTTQVPMPVLERQTQQQIIYNAPKPLAGLNGESHDFTITHQSPTTSNHTHNNVVEFEETSALPGRKSGSLVGISQIDSSHLTEREKRVIKREHVREAQKLVDNYKDTHSYNDRVKAQQKVNTLGEAHKNYFNKQINKVYNGK